MNLFILYFFNDRFTRTKYYDVPFIITYIFLVCDLLLKPQHVGMIVGFLCLQKP